MLQDRIKKNAKYFRGMEMTNGILIVKVLYEDKWGVYPKEDESVKVAKSNEIANEWYYYGDFDIITFDDVFDLIEETVEMNINAAKKIELLNQKFEELKNIFATESLQKLETLYFAFEEVKKPSKPKRKYNKKKKEEIIENVTETNEVITEIVDETNYENVTITQ